MLLMEILVCIFANAGNADAHGQPGVLPDLILRSFSGKGAIALSRMPSIRLVALISPADCPSCYECVLAELNRLILCPEWMNRVICCVVGKEADAAAFAEELRRRYAIGFGLVRAGEEDRRQRSFLSRVQTPGIFLIGDGLRLLAAHEVSPATFLKVSSAIDSLMAAPGPE